MTNIDEIQQTLFERELGSLIEHIPGIVTANDIFMTWASPNRLLGPEHGGEFDKVNPNRSRLMVLQEQRFIGGRSLSSLMNKVRIICGLLHIYGLA